jgi:hypothetical protein
MAMGHRRSNAGRVDRQLALNTLRCAYRGRSLRHEKSEQQHRQHDPAQCVRRDAHNHFRIRCPAHSRSHAFLFQNTVLTTELGMWDSTAPI